MARGALTDPAAPSIFLRPDSNAGQVSEWLKEPLSKSGIPKGIVGSNPTLSVGRR